MVSSASRSRGWSARGIAIAISVVALAGCGGEGPAASGEFATEPRLSDIKTEFPAGAAAPLSILAPSGDMAADPFMAAVECAAALEVTAKLIFQLSQVGESERTAVRQAEEAYRARAGRLARETPAPQAIATTVQRVRGDPSSQVRLAMNCLQQR
jgi:hypothetical protein